VPEASFTIELLDANGLPALANLHLVPSKTTDGSVVGVEDALSDELIDHHNGVTAGADGCFTTHDFSFSGATQRLVATLFFAPPVHGGKLARSLIAPAVA